MKLKAYIFSSLLTIFSFQTAHAQLLTDEWGDSETLDVQQKLQSITGRIIQVLRAKDFTAVINVCSAVLVNDDTIVSAAHCFKRNPFLSKTDSSELEKLQISSNEFYFDIPGVTTKDLNLAIAAISQKDTVKVFNQNKKTLEIILADLPKIGEIQILKEYQQNIPYELSTPHSRQWNYLGTIYDTSIAKLDRKVQSTPISIGELDKDNETVYASGYYGGNLSEPLRVFKCDRSRSVIDKLLPMTDLNDFANLLNNSKQLIVSYCDGEIFPGQSGGPQVQYKDGKILLVGINSVTLFSLTEYVASPIIYNIKNEFIF